MDLKNKNIKIINYIFILHFIILKYTLNKKIIVMGIIFFIKEIFNYLRFNYKIK